MRKSCTLIFAVSFILLSAACKKETNYCGYKGSIEFRCTGSSLGNYSIYINDSLLRTMNGGDLALYNVDTGWYNIKYTSGIPENVYIGPCENLIFEFPK